MEFPRAKCGFLLVREPVISVIVIDGVGLHSWSAESFVVLGFFSSNNSSAPQEHSEIFAAASEALQMQIVTEGKH